MKFAILDPRNTPEATAHNDAVFASGPVLGIEVTVTALAARCTLGNIDPQHSGSDSSQAACDVLLAWTPVGRKNENLDKAQNFVNDHMASIGPDVVLATIRPDLDSVASMAIFKLYNYGDPSCPMGGTFRPDVCDRVARISSADRFSAGPWRPTGLPTRENPWPNTGGTTATPELAALSAMCADHAETIERRVEMMAHWLLTGTIPGPRLYGDGPTGVKTDEDDGYPVYAVQVEDERQALIDALENGDIKRTLISNGSPATFAVVVSTHRAALQVGYSLAPVVVAYNPAFRIGGGEPHAKFTICRHEAGKYVSDWDGLKSHLQALEPGWGGSDTIIGSPQGVSSTLTLQNVVDVVGMSVFWQQVHPLALSGPLS